MKMDKLPARKAKANAIRWLRLEQRCAFIATEVGQHAADVLGINEKKMIEIEVKVTLSDLKNDAKKGYKHSLYNARYDFTQDQWVPTHFYYGVPTKLVERTKAFLEEREWTKYGVIDVETMKVIKRADWLHKKEPSSNVKFRCALRMGSELIRFHEAWL